MTTYSEDFKYIMHDLTTIYVGASFSYKELVNNDDVSFKLRSIISRVMLKDVAGDTKISDHIFFMDRESLSYMTLKHLKAKFKMNVFHAEANKGKGGYVSEIHTIDEIMDSEFLQKNRDTIFVEEMIVSKLNLAAIQI